MKTYFSGIGGIGISALAQFCLTRGDEILGSDLVESVMTKFLIKKGVTINFNQFRENITEDIDILVYSEAVSKDNPERKKAEILNIPTYSYFEYLGKISRDFKIIAVAGTHGKTTTVGMISNGLISAKKDPTVVVGTVLPLFNNTNFRSGNSDLFLVEACEYRENFRFLSPKIVVLTGIDHDHIDAFPTEKDYFQAFEKFISKAEKVIYLEDEESVARLLQNYQGQKIGIKNTRNFNLRLIGEFNQRNANLAYEVGKTLDCNLEDFEKGLQEFENASRRQEFLGIKNGVLYYDDYAHHPVEIDKLYQAFKEKFPAKKIGMVFEPHQHSRTKELFKDFCNVFANIDDLAFMPIYAARDSEEDKKFTINNFFIKNLEWKKVCNFSEMDNFSRNFSEGDVIIFCGAGNISDFGRRYLDL